MLRLVVVIAYTPQPLRSELRNCYNSWIVCERLAHVLLRPHPTNPRIQHSSFRQVLKITFKSRFQNFIFREKSSFKLTACFFDLKQIRTADLPVVFTILPPFQLVWPNKNAVLVSILRAQLRVSLYGHRPQQVVVSMVLDVAPGSNQRLVRQLLPQINRPLLLILLHLLLGVLF